MHLKRQTAYHTGVRSHTPLPFHEMCTHCRQLIRILLARQLANHKLITICWNLEWGTYDVSHLQILTCEVAVSTAGSVNLFAWHAQPPSSELRTPDWFIPASKNINFHSKPISSLRCTLELPFLGEALPKWWRFQFYQLHLDKPTDIFLQSVFKEESGQSKQQLRLISN